MSNLFVTLPMPALNGPGAAVDTSGMGSPKTIVVAGGFPGATIAVEVSVDGGVSFAPLVSFQTGDHEDVIPVAAQFMRVNVGGRKLAVPFAASANVAANDIGALFASIPMPVLNGPGTAVNVSAFGLFGTLVTGGSFAGTTITIEGSEDGVAYAPIAQFAGQGRLQSQEVTSNFIRANVSGRKTAVPFTGSLAFGAVNDPVGVNPAAPGDSQALIYRPGSVFTGPVVFNDWNDLYGQLQFMRSGANGSGVYEIVFDDELVSPCVIPSAAYDMTFVTWAGLLGKTSVVRVDEGASFSNLRRFVDDLSVVFTGATPPVSDFVADDAVAILLGAEIQCIGAGPFLRNLLGVGQVVFVIDVGGVVVGTTPVIDTATPGGFTSVLLNSALAVLAPGALSGVIGSTVLIATGSAGITIASETQPAVLGTLATLNTTKSRLDPTPKPPSGPLTGDTVLSDANQLALVDPSVGAPAPLIITLPPADGPNPNRGQTVIVKNVSALPGTISIVPQGGDTIDGTAGVTLSVPLGSLAFVSDGVSVWRLVSATDSAAPDVPAQHFIYTATGAEGVSFNVPLPAARATTLYLAQVTLAEQPGGLYEVEAPVSGYTLATIHLNTGVPVNAGDKFAISVFDLT